MRGRYTKTITPEMVKAHVEYDSETGELRWKRRPEKDNFLRTWNTRFAGKPAFDSIAPRGDRYYASGRLFGNLILAHAIAWVIHYGVWPTGDIDHISGNTLDNRICNLREVSRTDNARNMTISSRNTSGVVGVCYNTLRDKWDAHIHVDYRRLHLGHFASFEDAVKARKMAEKKYGFADNHGRDKMTLDDMVLDMEKIRAKVSENRTRKPYVKLQAQQVLEIVQSTECKYMLAKRYKVTDRTIRNIRAGRSRSDITGIAA